MQPLCFSSHFFLFPNSNLFQTAKNIAFLQVNAACVSRPTFFLFPNSQLIPKCEEHCVFTGKRCMSLSSHFFLFPNSRLIRLTWPCQWIFQLERHETALKNKGNTFSFKKKQHVKKWHNRCRAPKLVPVSPSDVFTSFGLQTLLWKHHSACCWSFSNLRKTLPFHK